MHQAVQVDILSRQCPNGPYPERPHDFNALFRGDAVPAQLFCSQCGEVREPFTAIEDERPGDDRIGDSGSIATDDPWT